MLKAVLFDVDGVLADSLEANVVFFQRLFVAGGYPAPSEAELRKCFHLTMWDIVEKFIGAEDQAEVERVWNLAEAPGVRNPEMTKFPEQLLQTLEKLHAKYKLAVVTGRTHGGIEEIFSVVEIRHLFSAVVSFQDYTNPKPDPEPLMIALERLKVKASEAIYIGDSDTDILAATAAGMRSIHLNRQPHPDATAAIGEFRELLAAIDTLATV